MAGCSLSPSAVGEWGYGIHSEEGPKCGLHRHDVSVRRFIQNFFADLRIKWSPPSRLGFPARRAVRVWQFQGCHSERDF